MCARENLTRQLNQRLSSRRYERLKRAPDGERACWPGGGAVADAGVGTEAADEDDAYVMMVLGRELGPAGTAHAACHGGVVRDQAALEGPRETHGVFEGHRGLQLDIDLQGGQNPR